MREPIYSIKSNIASNVHMFYNEYTRKILYNKDGINGKDSMASRVL